MFRYIRTRKLIERASLTPEGFVYLIVLCFITVGSVLRNVNLLILMAGMMYAPLFINWRLAVRRLRSFGASRLLPNRIHANKMVSIQWQCENQLAGIAAYNVIVDDQITRAADQTQGRESGSVAAEKHESLFERWFGELLNRLWRRQQDPNVSKAKVRFQRLIAHQPETQSYRAFFGQRGKYEASGASVSTSFPFGLIISRNFIDQTDVFFVAPELGRLEPTWEQRVQSTAMGSDSVKRNRAIEEDEFYALRPWRSGDSKKNIHWRTTARQGYPVVKQFDQQNNRDFAMVLDLFVDQPSKEALHRVEVALSFATTTLLGIGSEVQGQVAVGICGVNYHRCRSRTPAGMIADAMPVLATIQGANETNVVEAIVEAAESVSGGTPIYVVSTRRQPESLSTMVMPEEELEALSQHDPLQARELRHRQRRLRMALPLVRWLDVDSNQFRSIFSMASDEHVDGIPSGPQRSSSLKELNSMSRKWVSHA